MAIDYVQKGDQYIFCKEGMHISLNWMQILELKELINLIIQSEIVREESGKNIYEGFN